MVKQQCLFGTLLSIKVPGRHFLVSWILEERSQDDWAKQTIRRKRRKNHRNWDWASSAVQRAPPFQIKDDKEMFLLQESIEKYGILNSLIVRPVLDGYYEIISGHRRKYAAEKLGYRKVPVIIRVLSEDDSILSMRYVWLLSEG